MVTSWVLMAVVASVVALWSLATLLGAAEATKTYWRATTAGLIVAVALFWAGCLETLL